MRALTLHQPWASLIALGVKTIETRSWSTSYRGPLAIHAGKSVKRNYFPVGDWTFHADGDDGPELRRVGSVRDGVLVPDRYERGLAHPGPLGAVVATCTLVDVVPIAPRGYDASADFVKVVVVDGRGLVRCVDHRDDKGRRCISFRDEALYGDFTPGRFAWLLADVVPLDPPVPSPPGEWHRGLWTWEP